LNSSNITINANVNHSALSDYATSSNFSSYSNDSQFLQGHPASYFYQASNPFGFYNSTTLPAIDLSNRLYTNGSNANNLISFKNVSAERIVTDTTTPSASLDIGGGSILVIGAGGTAKALIQDDVNKISGMQMTNINNGTLADFRFLIKDTTGHYFTFSQPGINNADTAIFGLARKTTDFIFNVGGTPRDMAIGTPAGQGKLVFASGGTARISEKPKMDIFGMSKIENPRYSC
jgi:hypothetical protein